MTAKIYKGFTLIELLIVIAILGVLAVVVLVAINPVQQLARTRDSGRISSVAQIGHAVEAYMASHNGSYPTDLTELVTSGELTAIPSEVNNNLSALCMTDVLQGWCYETDETQEFLVWSRLEADTNITLGSCTDESYIVYMSAAGKACIVCDAPALGTTVVADCEN